jgi:uncharacterized protein YbaP (TraB family)
MFCGFDSTTYAEPKLSKETRRLLPEVRKLERGRGDPRAVEFEFTKEPADGDPIAVVAAMEEVVGAYPTACRLYPPLAEFYWLVGRCEQMARLKEAALQHCGDLSPVLAPIGGAAFACDDFASAEALLDKSVALDPASHARADLANVYAMHEKYDACIREADEYLRRYDAPNPPPEHAAYLSAARNARGACLMKLDRPDEALPEFERANTLVPRYPLFQHNQEWAKARAKIVADPSQKHFLWRVESPTTRVYLMGSIHVLTPEFYPLPEVIEQAFEESDTLVLEIDMFAPGQEKVLQSSHEYAQYEPGQSLKTELSEDRYMELLALMSRYHLSIEDFQHVRPWALSSLIGSMDASPATARIHAEHGVDVYFRRKAEGRKRVLELETTEGHALIMTALSDDEQVLMLQRAMQEQEQAVASFERMAELWRRGDADAINRQLQQDNDPQFEFYRRMMYDERNARMARRIQDFLKSDQTYFVVVGAGHMVGEQGLVALLQRRGYTVTQL